MHSVVPHLELDGVIIQAVLIQDAQALDQGVARGLVLMKQVSTKKHCVDFVVLCPLKDLPERCE